MMLGTTVWNPGGIGLTLMKTLLRGTMQHPLYTGNGEMELGLGGWVSFGLEGAERFLDPSDARGAHKTRYATRRAKNRRGGKNRVAPLPPAAGRRNDRGERSLMSELTLRPLKGSVGRGDLKIGDGFL